MPEIRKCSSRRPASGKKGLRGWFFHHRVVLKGVIGVGKTLLYIWSIWHRIQDDLWPFYVRITGQKDATRSASFSACVSRHEPDDFGRAAANFKILSLRN